MPAWGTENSRDRCSPEDFLNALKKKAGMKLSIPAFF